MTAFAVALCLTTGAAAAQTEEQVADSEAYPFIALQPKINAGAQPSVIDYAAMESFRRGYIVSGGYPHDSNWLEILFRYLESFRLQFSYQANQNPEAGWIDLVNHDLVGVSGQAKSLLKNMGFSSEEVDLEWSYYDLFDKDSFNSAASILLDTDMFAPVTVHIQAAEERYRRLLAVSRGIDESSSWASIMYQDFFRSAPDYVMAEIEEEGIDRLNELATADFYRRHYMWSYPGTSVNTSWTGFVQAEMMRARDDLIFRQNLPPGAVWTDLNNQSADFIKAEMEKTHGTVDPVLWQDIDSNDIEAVTVALVQLLQAPEGSTLEELTFYAQDFMRLRQARILMLPDDAHWEEIFVFDMLSDQGNRGPKAVLRSLADF